MTVDAFDLTFRQVETFGRNLDGGRAVLHLVILAEYGRGQLAALADGQHAGPEARSHGRGYQQPPGVDAGH